MRSFLGFILFAQFICFSAAGDTENYPRLADSTNVPDEAKGIFFKLKYKAQTVIDFYESKNLKWDPIFSVNDKGVFYDGTKRCSAFSDIRYRMFGEKAFLFFRGLDKEAMFESKDFDRFKNCFFMPFGQSYWGKELYLFPPYTIPAVDGIESSTDISALYDKILVSRINGKTIYFKLPEVIKVTSVYPTGVAVKKAFEEEKKKVKGTLKPFEATIKQRLDEALKCMKNKDLMCIYKRFDYSEKASNTAEFSDEEVPNKLGGSLGNYCNYFLGLSDKECGADSWKEVAPLLYLDDYLEALSNRRDNWYGCQLLPQVYGRSSDILLRCTDSVLLRFRIKSKNIDVFLEYSQANPQAC